MLMPGGKCHPGIVEFYDLFQIEGRLQLVMEYVDGKNALQWVRALDAAAADRQRRADRPAAALGPALCPFQGLCPPRHQALEPAGDGAGPSAPLVKLSDFGLAKSLVDTQRLCEPDPSGGRRRVDRLPLARAHPPVRRGQRARRHLLRGDVPCFTC